MRNLGRPLLRLFGRDDRGAIGILVAVLIGAGVLLGMAALVIDVGQIYQNRAELQNGADSGALAIARLCAQGTCPTAPTTVAGTYASENASALTQGAASVNVVCGSDNLGSCDSVVGPSLTDCPSSPTDPNAHFVDVQTETKMGSGSHLLPPVFAETLVGGSTYNGTTVKACAQAQWGPPSSMHTIAFTISACSWYTYTNNGADFAQPPPYPPNTMPSPSDDHILYEHGSTSSTTNGCPEDNASGADGPGNFGWTQDTSNCTTLISDLIYYGSTGAPAKGDCTAVLSADQQNKTVVYLPIYSAINASGGGPGANQQYTLLGFAAFVITGYHIPRLGQAKDWLNSANDCTGNQFCIDGYFTHALIPPPGPPGGTDLGLVTFTLTG